jgi:hypothetical protein
MCSCISECLTCGRCCTRTAAVKPVKCCNTVAVRAVVHSKQRIHYSVLVTLSFTVNQFAANVLFLLTFYILKDTLDTMIHSAANTVQYGDDEMETELPLSSMSSISGSETNDRRLHLHLVGSLYVPING